MLFAALEQMRRYGVPERDIAATISLARALANIDAVVFRGDACPIRAERHGPPSSCVSYLTWDDGECYRIHVEALAERLELQAIALICEHGHRTDIDEDLAQRLIIDAIALHEVRHRLQQKRGADLRLWKESDLPLIDAAVMREIVAELPPNARTEREIDARIVEYLYVQDRLANVDRPLDAVHRVPR